MNRRKNSRRKQARRVLAIRHTTYQIVKRLRRRKARSQDAIHVELRTGLMSVQRRFGLRLNRLTRRVRNNLTKRRYSTILLILLIRRPQRAMRNKAIRSQIKTRRTRHRPALMSNQIQRHTLRATSIIAPRTRTKKNRQRTNARKLNRTVRNKFTIATPIRKLLLTTSHHKTHVRTNITLTMNFFSNFRRNLIMRLNMPIIRKRLQETIVPSSITQSALTRVNLSNIRTLVRRNLSLILRPFANNQINRIRRTRTNLPRINLPSFTVKLTRRVTLIFIRTLRHKFSITRRALIPLRVTPVRLTRPMTIMIRNHRQGVAFNRAISRKISNNLNILKASLGKSVTTIISRCTVPVKNRMRQSILMTLLKDDTTVLVPSISTLAVLRMDTRTFTRTMCIFTGQRVRLSNGRRIKFVANKAIRNRARFTSQLNNSIQFNARLRSTRQLTYKLDRRLTILTSRNRIPKNTLSSLRNGSTDNRHSVHTVSTSFTITVTIHLGNRMVAITKFINVRQRSKMFNNTLPIFNARAGRTFHEYNSIRVRYKRIRNVMSTTRRKNQNRSIRTFNNNVHHRFMNFADMRNISTIAGRPMTINRLRYYYSLIRE